MKELTRRRRKTKRGGLKGEGRRRKREKKDENTIKRRTRIGNVKAELHNIVEQPILRLS